MSRARLVSAHLPKVTVPCRERLHPTWIPENNSCGWASAEHTHDIGVRVANPRKDRINWKPGDSLRNREEYHWRPIWTGQVRVGGYLSIVQDGIQADDSHKDIWRRRNRPRRLGLKN